MTGGRRFYTIRDTRFGPVAVLWDKEAGRPLIRQVILSTSEDSADRVMRNENPSAVPLSCERIDEVLSDMARFLDGIDARFDLSLARLDLCPAFQQKVLRAEYAIPRGYVSTYSRIAAHLGVPKGARAVGNALATNPFPIIIPCHRAIRSDGSLGGYQGGLAMKRQLLEYEGIEFDESGRVLLPKFFY